MALWTRSGVVARPSRAGSSPSRTSISRTRSSNRALVSVGVSAFWSNSEVFMLADKLPFSITAPHALRRKAPQANKLADQLRVPGVFKGVHHGFFQSHSFQMRMGEAALQNI